MVGEGNPSYLGQPAPVGA